MLIGLWNITFIIYFIIQIECIEVCGKNLYIGTNDWYV